MNKLDKEYSKKLKFRAKPDTWYIENTWVEVDNSEIFDCDGGVIDNGLSLFNGWTMESFDGCTELLPRFDGELCSLTEFDIFYTKSDGVTHIQLNGKTCGEIINIINNDV